MRWELKKAIHDSGVRQKWVADQLQARGMAVTELDLSRIVTGRTREVPPDVQAALADLLNVSIDRLFPSMDKYLSNSL
jgi:hypothetical protein